MMSNYYGDRKGQLVFGDALYFRSPENVLSLEGVTEEKIIRALCVYLVYGYLDLAQTLCELSNERGVISKKSYNSISSVFTYFKSETLSEFYAGTDIFVGNR